MRWLICAVALMAAPVVAAPIQIDDAMVLAKLTPGGEAMVTDIVDGDTLIIDPALGGARQVRLVGIQAPKLPLGRKGFRAWPLAADSKRALERLALRRRVRLAFGGARMDRHGRHLAHLFRDDGVWVQGLLLADGMARVYTFHDNRAVTPAMLAREHAARDGKLGIWTHPFYAVRAADPAHLMNRLGTFQLIEGTVRAAARVKSRIYLNFGDNWRTDFTITLDGQARRLFEKAGIDLLSLQAQTVRVRGWLRKRNGPMVQVSHPEQIEFQARKKPAP